MVRFALIALMLLSVTVNAQNDSIKWQIMNYPESKSDLISKARRLILDKFIEGDIVTVLSTMRYVENEIEDDDYTALWAAEKIFINFWAADYVPILGFFHVPPQNQAVSSTKIPDKIKIEPAPDLLLYKLREQTSVKFDSIDRLISVAFLDNEAKDFLHILLEHISSSNRKGYYSASDEDARLSLNDKANRFIESYPESKYASYIKAQVCEEYFPSKLGIALGLGSGYTALSGELSRLFTNPIPLIFNVDAEYMRVSLLMSFLVGFNRTNTDMTYSGGVFPKGEATRQWVGEFDLGYRIYDSKRFKIIPFVGITQMSFEATSAAKDKDEALKELSVKCHSYDFGLSSDFKIPRCTQYMYGVESSYMAVRLKYAYRLMQFGEKYRGFTGNMHSITLGMTWFGRNIKNRDGHIQIIHHVK